MSRIENLETLSKEDCLSVSGGNLISLGRWVVGTIGGGLFYDGVKSAVSSANTAWNSISSRIIGSHYKAP